MKTRRNKNRKKRTLVVHVGKKRHAWRRIFYLNLRFVILLAR